MNYIILNHKQEALLRSVKIGSDFGIELSNGMYLKTNKIEDDPMLDVFTCTDWFICYSLNDESGSPCDVIAPSKIYLNEGI